MCALDTTLSAVLATWGSVVVVLLVTFPAEDDYPRKSRCFVNAVDVPDLRDSPRGTVLQSTSPPRGLVPTALLVQAGTSPSPAWRKTQTDLCKVADLQLTHFDFMRGRHFISFLVPFDWYWSRLSTFGRYVRWLSRI